MNLRDITTDSSNNVILTGYFFGSLDLGAGPMVSAGQADAFVVKYDALGNLVWSKRFGGTGGESSIGLATDGQGDIAFVGQHTAPADFGGGTLPSEGGGDVYVVKLDPAGNHLWSKSFGDAAKQAPLDIASDPAGCFMINGIYQGTVDFGGNPLVSAGDDDVFLVKLGIDGEHLWSHGFGDAERQVGQRRPHRRPASQHRLRRRTAHERRGLRRVSGEIRGVARGGRHRFCERFAVTGFFAVFFTGFFAGARLGAVASVPSFASSSFTSFFGAMSR